MQRWDWKQTSWRVQVCNAWGECEAPSDGEDVPAPPVFAFDPPPQAANGSDAPAATGTFAYGAWSQCISDCSAPFGSAGRQGYQRRSAECVGDCAGLEAEAQVRACMDTPCFDDACEARPCGEEGECGVASFLGDVRPRLYPARVCNVSARASTPPSIDPQSL